MKFFAHTLEFSNLDLSVETLEAQIEGYFVYEIDSSEKYKLQNW